MPSSGKQLKHCEFCRKAFATQRSVNQHISASIICLKEWQKDIIRNVNPSRKRRHINSPKSSSLDDSDLPNDNPDHPTGNDDPMENLGADDNHWQGRLGDGDNLASPKRYVEPFLEPAGVALRLRKPVLRICWKDNGWRGKPHGNHLLAEQSGGWRNG